MQEFVFTRSNSWVKTVTECILDPASEHSIVMILGETGSGKSHLAEYIRAEWKIRGREGVAVRVMAEDLIQERIRQLRLREQMIGTDFPAGPGLCIIDNIEYIRKKSATAGELGFMAERLYRSGVQVILLGAEGIPEYQDLWRAITERHAAALLLTLNPLSSFEKMRFIQKNLGSAGLHIDHHALHRIAAVSMGEAKGYLHTLLRATADRRAAEGQVTLDAAQIEDILGVNFWRRRS